MLWLPELGTHYDKQTGIAIQGLYESTGNIDVTYTHRDVGPTLALRMATYYQRQCGDTIHKRIVG